MNSKVPLGAKMQWFCDFEGEMHTHSYSQGEPIYLGLGVRSNPVKNFGQFFPNERNFKYMTDWHHIFIYTAWYRILE